MKKIFFLVISIIIFCSSVSAQNFKAKEGVAKAKETASITNPELLAVATINGSLPGVQLPITFDMSNGSSNIWVYVLRSADNHDVRKNVAVSKLFGTTIGVVVPDIATMPQLPLTSLESVTWIDSDVMIDKVKTASGYQSFMTQYPSAKPDLITLMYNSVYQQVPLDEPYWLVKINSGGQTEPSLICAVNATTQETICFDATTSVKDFMTNEITLNAYPNPASSTALIYLPTTIQSNDAKLALCDLDGRVVKNLIAPKTDGIEFVLVNLSDIQPGIYFARYSTADKSYFVKINLIK